MREKNTNTPAKTYNPTVHINSACLGKPTVARPRKNFQFLAFFEISGHFKVRLRGIRAEFAFNEI